ncbi:MAG TPA: lamin tail domain-containing protein [Rudaea sp.]|jgi:predicted extracellular nuclease|nr:lamin tail domain-containing protein [Rudaea sp.]
MSGKFICRLLGLALLAGAGGAQAQVVISQFYGGGGNSGATYKSDFIELFNAGTSTVDLSTWSVQYNSSTGTGAWQKTNLSGSIAPGQYFLVKEADGSGGTVNLPTPDVTGTISMGAGGGRVILASTQTTYPAQSPSGCPADMSAIADLLGVSGASCVEGTGAAAPSATNALFRAGAGCTDTNNNAADFSLAAPAPRNTATATNVCGGSGNPGGSGSANPNSVPNDGATATLLTVVPTPGSNPTSASYTVSADLSSIGGSATQTFYDDGSNGDVTPGDGTFSFSTTVANATSPGAKSLPATIVDDQARTGTTSIALTVTQAPTSATIMQIQGHGAASLLNAQNVTTTGVVTAVGPKGFFMQDPAGDGDPTTSDGIYVFTSSAPTVAVGNAVSVSAKVQEYSGSTELTAPAVSVTNPTAPVMPQAYVLDANPPTSDPTTGPCVGTGSTINPPVDGYQASNFACLDGMLVKMNDAVVTGATFGGKINTSDPVGSDAVHTGLPNGFYATLASQPRPFHGPGALYPGLGGTIPVWNGAPQVIEIYYKGLAFAPGSDSDPYDNDPTDYVYHAGTRFSVTGVIQGYQPSGATSPIYELYPASMTTIMRATPADEVQPVSDPVDGTLTFGTQNLLHMFNDVLDGSADTSNCPSAPALGGSDWCPTTAQYQARLAKWTRQVCTVLKAPVVLDVEEIESLAVAHDLAAKIADNTSTGSVGCGVTYQTYVIPGNDVGGINIGILVRSDVAVDSVTQLYKGTTTSYCSSGTSCLLNDRPPVLMQATWNGYKFALLAIYGRSLSGIDTKPYVGPKRAQQAAQIASIADAWQNGQTLIGAGNAQQAADGTITTGSFDVVGDASVPLVVAGDFNAYEFSDGYADVTGLITGNAVQSDNKYWPSPYAAPNPTLIDSGIRANPGLRYSFNYDGLAQEIDHIVLSRRAWQDFVRVENAHGNSDTSEASNVILDPVTAARAGDHDGQVMTITIDRIFANGFEDPPYMVGPPCVSGCDSGTSVRK